MNYEYLMKSWLTWASCPSTSSQTRRGLTEFRAENYEAAQDESAIKTTYLRINIDMKRNNINSHCYSSVNMIILWGRLHFYQIRQSPVREIPGRPRLGIVILEDVLEDLVRHAGDVCQGGHDEGGEKGEEQGAPHDADVDWVRWNVRSSSEWATPTPEVTWSLDIRHRRNMRIGRSAHLAHMANH